MFKCNLTNLIITLLTILVTIMLYLKQIKDGGIKVDLKLSIEQSQPPERRHTETATPTAPRQRAAR